MIGRSNCVCIKLLLLTHADSYKCTRSTLDAYLNDVRYTFATHDRIRFRFGIDPLTDYSSGRAASPVKTSNHWVWIRAEAKSLQLEQVEYLLTSEVCCWEQILPFGLCYLPYHAVQASFNLVQGKKVLNQMVCYNMLLVVNSGELFLIWSQANYPL